MDALQTFFFGRSLFFHAEYHIEDPIFGDANPYFGLELYQNFLTANAEFDPFMPEPFGTLDPDFIINLRPYNLDPSVPYLSSTVLQLQTNIYNMCRQMFLLFSHSGWDHPYLAPSFFLGELAYPTECIFRHPYYTKWGVDLSEPYFLQSFYCRCLILFEVTATDIFTDMSHPISDNDLDDTSIENVWEVFDLFALWIDFPGKFGETWTGDLIVDDPFQPLPYFVAIHPDEEAENSSWEGLMRDLLLDTFEAYLFYYKSPGLLCIFQPRSK